jgi:hypothetical protein
MAAVLHILGCLQEELGDVSIQCRIFGFKFEKLFPHSLQL